MKKLQKICILGMGLMGGSVSMAIYRSNFAKLVVGFSHLEDDRRKARQMGVADEISGDMAKCVADADVVILATPIFVFKKFFSEIANSLKSGCIVTDVGSTKVMPHKWAAKSLPKNVRYVGSHPIAGSEKSGVEFARDDLCFGAKCIITSKKTTDPQAIKVLSHLWSSIGCHVERMTPAEHDRIFGNVSHLPHVTAAALVNAGKPGQMEFAGKGFIDTSRVASGPANVWSDILMTNAGNTVKAIEKVISELRKIQDAIAGGDQKKIEKLLTQASDKRAALIEYKIKKKELL